MPSSPAWRRAAALGDARGVGSSSHFIRCNILPEVAETAQSLEQAIVGVHVLVAAAGEVKDDEIIARHFWRALN